MSGKNYETLNTELECEETLHPDDYIFLCQEPIKEVHDAAAVTSTQLSPKAGINSWKGKGQAESKSETKQLHFRDTFKKNYFRYINEDHDKSILESHMFLN